MRQTQQVKTHYGLIWGVVISILFIFCLGMFAISRSQDTQNQESELLTELSTLAPERTITQEEYDFFAALSKKHGIDPENSKIQRFITEKNAEFYLGSQLGLCEPFEFSAFQYRTAAENNDRAMKKLTGQIYYGPDSFSEESYFEYINSRLRSDIITWLLDHRDAGMVAKAEIFFHDNEERFAPITSVTYELTVNGTTKTCTIENTMFKTLGQSDPALMDFLAAAKDGEEKLLTDGSNRLVKRIGISTELLPFEEQERFAVEIWISQVAVHELISQISDNSNLVF